MSLIQKQKTRKFIITYDGDSYGLQTFDVSHEKFYSDVEFQNFIIYQKCLDCNFESHFEKV